DQDLDGTDATNYLDGGQGSERLVGGGEFDIYYFETGDGNDVIFDYELNPFRTFADSIYFGDEIDVGDVTFERDGGSGDLLISYGGSGDSIVVENQFFKLHTAVFGSYFSHAIEYLVFGSGDGITADTIMARLISQYSTDGNDVIYGFDREDTIDGGQGDDWMQGGNGNDIYRFGHGYGSDTIHENMVNILSGTIDRVAFNDDVAFGDVEFLRVPDSNDLLIRLDDGSELNIVSQFDAYHAGPFGIITFDQVEFFDFENVDGSTTTYSSLDIQEIILDNASTDGNDTIVGFYTDDTLEGGLGDDFLTAGDGDDVYRYNLGDGNDTIHEQNPSILIGGNDAIEFGPGIVFDDLSLSRGAGEKINDLIITVNQTGETITVDSQFWYGTINYRPDRIEELRFDDGQVVSALEIEAAYLAAAKTAGNDVITGFNSSDVLDGGAGNDILAGDAGDDTYIFDYGYGHDIIREDIGYITYGDFDVVKFGDTVTFSDVKFELGNSTADLRITLISTGDTLEIEGQNLKVGYFGFTWYDIEQFEFADGTILSKQDVFTSMVASQATEFDDQIFGFYTDDMLDGLGGNDRIEGGNGADTYLFGYGSGNDTVLDESATFSDAIDRVQFGAGIAQGDVSFSNIGDDLVVTLISSGETLTLERYLGGNHYYHIEELVFEDDSVLSRADVQQILVGGQGTTGDDIITGTNGDDLILGGEGNDELHGEGGDDTYLFRAGDGQDIIQENGFGTFDRISVEGYEAGEIIFGRQAPESNNLIISFTGSSDQITVIDGLDGDYFDTVEEVTFSDGTTITIAEIRQRILDNNSTSGDDYLAGFNSYSNSNLVEVLAGGLGDDYVTGLEGDDIYQFTRGDGRDTIRESGFDSYDVLEISGYQAGELHFSRSHPGSSDLLIEFTGSDDRITIINTLGGDAWDTVELLRLDDGTEFTIAQIHGLIAADINASSSPVAVGTHGDDSLEAGGGVKLISGEGGDDLFTFTSGDGELILLDDAFGTTDTLHIAGYDPTDVTIETNPHLNRDMIISFAGSQEFIRVMNSINAGGFNAVEFITFDDGTIWDSATLTSMATQDTGTYIEGSQGDDTFTGTGDNEYFLGKRGMDTYQFTSGFGHDEINDSSNRVELIGIDALDVQVIRPSLDGSDLLLVVKTTGDSVLIKGALSGDSASATQIIFDDGTTWDSIELGQQLIADLASEGDDYVHGFGDNTADIIGGGAGNDFLRGDSGSDIYQFSRGDGRDTIDDGGSSEIDQLLISGYQSGEVIFSKLTPDSDDSEHLLIRFVDSTDEIIIRDTLSGQWGSIEEIVLDDGTIWQTTEIADFLNNDNLVATDDGGLQGVTDTGLQISTDDLLDNDLADAGAVLRIASVYGAINGAVSLSGDIITFTPAAGYEGPAEFTYVVIDDNNIADTAKVSISIAAAEAELPANAVILNIEDVLGSGNSGNGVLAFDAILDVAGGSAEINSAGEVVFTPDSEYSGIASFSYVITGGGQPISGEHYFEFSSANSAPELITSIAGFSAAEDSDFNYQIDPASFSDAQSDELNFLAKLGDGSPLPDWLSFDPVNLTFSGRAPQDFNGILDIELTAADAQFTASDSFTIEITPVNDAPVVDAGLAQQTSEEDSAFSFAIPAGAFSDIDGDQLTITASQPDGSALPSWLLFDGSTFSGTPPQDFNGTIDIKLTAFDGALGVDHEFGFRVLSVNDAPEIDQAIVDQTGSEDAPFTFQLPDGIFSDRDGTFLAITANLADGSPLPAWLSFDGSTFSGTPPQDYNGVLNVAVIASDGLASVTDNFNIDITAVNDAPIVATALTDQSSDEDNALSFTLPAGAFADVDGDNLVVSATLADGSALPQWLSFDGSTFSGTPPQDFNGILEFEVSATDGALSASDNFQLTINAVNDAPVIVNAMGDQSFDEDSPVNFVVPADTFSDVEGDALVLSATMGDGSELPSWLAFDGSGFTGTPPANFHGVLALKINASDGALGVSTDFNLAIEAVNDNPVVTGLIADQNSTEDQSFSFSIPGDLFADVDGDVLTISSRLANGGDLPDWITFTGTQFNGTPPPDFNGSVEIHVVANDGTVSTSTSFTLNVAPVNDAPVVAGSISDQSVDEDQAVSFSLPAGLFADVDGDTLIRTARLVNGAALPAWLIFDGTSFAGTPPQDFNGTLALSVEASDGEFSTQTQFNLIIAAVNDAPSTDATIINQTITEDLAFSFDLPADAFTDIDGDNLTLTAAMPNGDALPGWLAFDGSTFSGTPPQNFNTAGSGALSIVVTASDGELEASQTFDLDVTGVDDPVILANPLLDQTSDEDQLFSYTLPDDIFVDVDGDVLTVAASLNDGAPLPAWLSFDGSTFSGTPPQDYNGSLELQLSASDGNSQAVDEFTLTISPVNDAPVAQDDFGFAVDENSSVTILASDLLANDSDVEGDALSIVSVHTDG
ncbi:MAG: tandem-95 repeat protein, partial [Gammaproteobacteria bacterium]|nr:tandem-95 repeat protein [Gammaproteobacteria bacterium]